MDRDAATAQCPNCDCRLRLQKRSRTQTPDLGAQASAARKAAEQQDDAYARRMREEEARQEAFRAENARRLAAHRAAVIAREQEQNGDSADGPAPDAPFNSVPSSVTLHEGPAADNAQGGEKPPARYIPPALDAQDAPPRRRPVLDPIPGQQETMVPKADPLSLDELDADAQEDAPEREAPRRGRFARLAPAEQEDAFAPTEEELEADIPRRRFARRDEEAVDQAADEAPEEQHNMDVSDVLQGEDALLQGDAMLQEQQYNQALFVFKTAANASPEDYRAWWGVATATLQHLSAYMRSQDVPYNLSPVQMVYKRQVLAAQRAMERVRELAPEKMLRILEDNFDDDFADAEEAWANIQQAYLRATGQVPETRPGGISMMLIAGIVLAVAGIVLFFIKTLPPWRYLAAGAALIAGIVLSVLPMLRKR